MDGKTGMEQEFETMIGLEVHVELATQTKIFCGCKVAFGAQPNSQTCPVCLGMPGTLPVLNRKVVEHAIRVGLALNCAVTENCRFDRKNYFYPDNPQNYQISQLYLPICRDGYLEIDTGEQRKHIGIHEIHMEEDAGKLLHATGQDSPARQPFCRQDSPVRQPFCRQDSSSMTKIDHNRAGVPLIEIVTEPDLENASDTIAFLDKLRHLITYLGASDCKLQEGSMRVDVNLSVRRRGEAPGVRTEMKNLNSFRAITRAIETERKRQIEIIVSGGEVIQETRRWDDAKGESYSMRSKEDAKDYRYFPEPDLPPVRISREYILRMRERLPEFREERCERIQKEYDITQKDALLLTDSCKLADLFEKTVFLGTDPKQVSNWLIGETLRILKEREMDPEELLLSPEGFRTLIDLSSSKKITNTVAKEIFEKMCLTELDPLAYVEEHGLLMVSDEAFLKETVEKIIARNPQSVADYRAGKDRAIGYLVGQVMKETKGKADPVLTAQLLKESL